MLGYSSRDEAANVDEMEIDEVLFGGLTAADKNPYREIYNSLLVDEFPVNNAHDLQQPPPPPPQPACHQLQNLVHHECQYYNISGVQQMISSGGGPSSERPILQRPLRQKKVTEHWSSEEHVLFLRGLEKYGKSKWKLISKHFVKTKDPIQIGSHAQKHFLRQKKPSSTIKNRRKRSNFDLTISDDQTKAPAETSDDDVIEFPPLLIQPTSMARQDLSTN